MNQNELTINVPVVSCIIEKVVNEEKCILLQTRYKPWTAYHQTVEIPAGWIEKYENVFSALTREVKEETWLDIIEVYPRQEDNQSAYHMDLAFSFQAFCCQQYLNGENWLPRISMWFVAKVWDWEPVFQESETREPRRVSIAELKDMLEKTPEKFFTLQLPLLLFYLKHHEEINWTIWAWL